MTAPRTDADTATPIAETLDRLERAHAAATPGPWSATQDFIDQGVPDCTMTIHGGDGGYVATVSQSYRGEDSAAAIVAAHNALPSLLAAVRGVLALADSLDVDSCDPQPDWRARLLFETADRLRAVVTAALGESR